METTIVICVNSIDFRRWMLDNHGINHRSDRRMCMVGDHRFIAVTNATHLVGNRCNHVVRTELARITPSYLAIFMMAETYCTIHLPHQKPFKFGR